MEKHRENTQGLYQFKSGEIDLLWHLGFHDGILSAIAELTDTGEKVFMKCVHEGHTIFIDDQHDPPPNNELPRGLRRYMRENNIISLEDLPDYVDFGEGIFEKWSAETTYHDEHSQRGSDDEDEIEKTEMEIHLYRTFYVYELTDERFEEEERIHRLFQQFVGHHTDYSNNVRLEGHRMKPRREWLKFYDHPDVINRRPSHDGRLLGYVYYPAIRDCD